MFIFSFATNITDRCNKLSTCENNGIIFNILNTIIFPLEATAVGDPVLLTMCFLRNLKTKLKKKIDVTLLLFIILDTNAVILSCNFLCVAGCSIGTYSAICKTKFEQQHW